jgi:hypothetical protein
MRTLDGLIDVRDMPAGPDPQLVPEEANVARPARPYRAFPNDTARGAVAVSGRSGLDDVPAVGQTNLERGVVKVECRPTLDSRLECLVDPTVHPHEMSAGTER